jgi:osmoprotectant transport system ATP-binding protein
VGEVGREVRARARLQEERHVLLIDDLGRPIGWVDSHDIPDDVTVTSDDADPMSPLLDRRTTLKDATSMLLAEEVRSGIVVDRDGRVLGLLTLEAVMGFLRDGRSRAVPADIAEAIAEVLAHPGGDHEHASAEEVTG